MEKLFGKSRLGFQGMAEGVAQIEQGSCTARLTLILGNDTRLGRNTSRHGFLQWRLLHSQDRIAMLLQPIEKTAIAKDAVFENFGISGAHLALGEGREGFEVGKHQGWLVKGSDQIFSCRCIDRRFPSNRTIDLR